VDKGPKLYSPETLKLNTLINLKRFTPTPDLFINRRESGILTPDLVIDKIKSGILTPLLSLYNNTLNNINLLLLASTFVVDALIQAPVHNIINIDNLLNINK
jgi:hypothetical protein